MTAWVQVENLFTVGRIASMLRWEKMTHTTARRRNELPGSIDAVSNDWLTAVLCSKHPEARVLEMVPGAGSDGTTSRRALRVRYNEAGEKLGLPTALFTKAASTLTTRLVAGYTGIAANEAGFYNDIRPTLDIEAPRALFAANDAWSCKSFFLFEDISVTRKCVFVDARNYVDRPMIESMIRLLAVVHGKLWNSPRLTKLPWLRTALRLQEDFNRTIAFEKRSAIGIDRSLEAIPASLIKRRNELWPAFMHSLQLSLDKPVTLIHSDVHLGNWYKTPEQVMGLCDWQAVCAGRWASDFAYLLLSALTIEDRRAWERELLAYYIEQLGEAGYSLNFDHAWSEYRQHTLHAFFFWVFTIGAGALQPNMQPDAFSLINIKRMAQGIVDLETLDALKG